MARSIGVPRRIAVGLVFMHGAFYYHAWPEVYVTERPVLGLWLPVDPTLNQFPADATHLRLARGGLAQQAAILPLIGRLKMTIVKSSSCTGTEPRDRRTATESAATPAAGHCRSISRGRLRAVVDAGRRRHGTAEHQ
jgi:transglutaminase-like putative cysteine protease